MPTRGWDQPWDPAFLQLGFGRNPTSLPPSHPRARGLPKILSLRCNYPVVRWLHPGASNGGVFGVRAAPFPSWGLADTGFWWGAGALWGRGVVLSKRCRGPALGSRCCGAVFGAGFEPFWVPACAEVWGSSNFGVQPHTVPLPRSPSSHQPRGAPSEPQRGETRGFWRRAWRFWEGELRGGVVLG